MYMFQNARTKIEGDALSNFVNISLFLLIKLMKIKWILITDCKKFNSNINFF